MSQITQFELGSMSNVETLTGDSGGAVGPDGVGNIDILGGTGITTVGNPGANSVTINSVADGFEVVSVQTTGAVTGDLFTFTLPDLNSIQIFASISASIADYSASLQGTVNGGARRSGGGAVLIGSPIASFNEDSGGSPLIDIVVSGNDVIVRVSNDVALEVWNWRGLIQYVHLTV